MKKFLNRQGFTLIELVVVMAIIAILFAAVLIAADPASKFAEARNTQRRNDLRIILTAIYQYYSDNGQTFPATNTTTTASDYASGYVNIKNSTGLAGGVGLDWCAALLPYLSNGFPHDPTNATTSGSFSWSSCPADGGGTNGIYDSKYAVKVASVSGGAAKQVSVSAQATELSATITLSD